MLALTLPPFIAPRDIGLAQLAQERRIEARPIIADGDLQLALIGRQFHHHLAAGEFEGVLQQGAKPMGKLRACRQAGQLALAFDAKCHRRPAIGGRGGLDQGGDGQRSKGLVVGFGSGRQFGQDLLATPALALQKFHVAGKRASLGQIAGDLMGDQRNGSQRRSQLMGGGGGQRAHGGKLAFAI